MILLPLGLVFLYAFATKWFASSPWWPQEMGTKWVLSIFQTENLVERAAGTPTCSPHSRPWRRWLITFPAAYVLGTRGRGRRPAGPPAAIESVLDPAARLPDHHASRSGSSALYRSTGLTNELSAGIVLAHMVMAVPYALRAMVGSFLLVPVEYEEAARNLGATPGCR